MRDDAFRRIILSIPAGKVSIESQKAAIRFTIAQSHDFCGPIGLIIFRGIECWGQTAKPSSAMKPRRNRQHA
jgi:hypothetical protein